MTDFKFEIGEHVVVAGCIQKINYRFIQGAYRRYVTTSQIGEEAWPEESLSKIPKPKKKLYQAVYNDCDVYYVGDYLFSSIEEAQNGKSAKVIKLIEPGIEVDE